MFSVRAGGRAHYALAEVGRRKHQKKPKRREATRFQQRMRRRAKGSHEPPRRRAPEITVEVPRVLSVVEQPEDIARFLSKLASLTPGPWPKLSIKSEHVERATPDGLAALLAGVLACGCPVKGDIPKNEPARSTFKDSGIFDDEGITRRWADVPKNGQVFRQYGRVADGDFAKEIVRFASQKLGVDGGRSYGVYRLIMECMANTHNHGDNKKRDKYSRLPSRREGVRWYMHAHHDRNRNRVCFTFLDHGIGIIKSLIVRRVLGTDVIKMAFSGRVLRNAFHGEYPSRTEKLERGLGLDGIRGVAANGKVSRLVAVANRGYVDLVAGKYRNLPANFPGTLIYWEIEARHLTPS